MSGVKNIFRKLGGYREVAKQIDRPLTTVQYWWDKERVPDEYKPKMIAMGAEKGVEIALEEFFPKPKLSKKPRSN